jgi:serine/threonine protein kinase
MNTIMNGIRLLRPLGSGSYGSVYLGEDVLSGARVAVKVIPTKADEEELSSALNEVEALRQLKHPNIIEQYSVQENASETRIVMRFAENGDLLHHTMAVGKHSEAKARRLFTQTLKAVAHAHKNGWIHRDIKLENILLDGSENALLADWGFACRWSPNTFLEESVGSIHYASPEIVRGASYIGPEVDCWSLGVVLYALVAGAFPFGDNAHAIVAGRYRIPAFVSAECAALIRGLLELDPRKRLTAEEALRHPFITGAESTPQRSCSMICASPLESIANSPRVAFEPQPDTATTGNAMKSMPSPQEKTTITNATTTTSKVTFPRKVKGLLRNVFFSRRNY